MIRVIHLRCNQVAFYFKEKVNVGDPIVASNVVLLDNATAHSGELIKCGSCNENINFNFKSLQQESWKDWFIVKHL